MPYGACSCFRPGVARKALLTSPELCSFFFYENKILILYKGCELLYFFDILFILLTFFIYVVINLYFFNIKEFTMTFKSKYITRAFLGLLLLSGKLVASATSYDGVVEELAKGVYLHLDRVDTKRKMLAIECFVTIQRKK